MATRVLLYVPRVLHSISAKIVEKSWPALMLHGGQGQEGLATVSQHPISS